MTLDRTDVFEEEKVKHAGLAEAGSRMDQAILEHQISRQPKAVQEWFESAPLRTRLKLKRNVERAKIELAIKAEAIVELPGTNFEPIRLTDDLISIALQAILARMTGVVAQAVTRQLGGLDEVDFVVMSGGTSLSKAVQNSIRALFNHVPEARFVLPDARKP